MNSRLIVEPLPLLDELLRTAHPADEAVCREYTECRRREFLAWRAIVRRELGSGIVMKYMPDGRPYVDGGPFISVSHSSEIVAVRISDTLCAVDTEPLDRSFERVKARRMTAAEESLSDDPRLTAAVWCAKEALYKLSGITGIDRLRDIRISEVNFAAGHIVGSVRDGAPVTFSIEYFDRNIIVFV